MITNRQLNYSTISENNKNNTIQSISFKIHDNNINRMSIIHRAAIQQLTENRHGNACTKTRSEVSGGGKKPWKQKGTGRARAGSIRSPLWKSGGIIFGPKPRKYIQKINRKEKQLALKTLIFNKFKHTIVVDNFIHHLEKPSSKTIIQRIKSLGLNIQNKEKILIIVKTKNTNVYLSLRNLRNIDLVAADQINILSLLQADKLIITQNALNKIKQIYND
uniref:Large ribosomal subunit protein uL4c n=1 Tax=Sebdenia flabellata TaxID=42024 RepID=A0A1C9CA80_9FLOR|nr:ribosomal protein L4 [Sebdenia flabellata]AOM65291.1 ribosomal protein L4 [Sebdenia flabellata]